MFALNVSIGCLYVFLVESIVSKQRSIGTSCVLNFWVRLAPVRATYNTELFQWHDARNKFHASPLIGSKDIMGEGDSHPH